MKYKILITFLCSFFVGLLCFKICFNTDENMQKIAHIYIDPATTGSVFQMADFVQQSKSDPKYILWSRFNHLRDKNFFKENNVFNASDPSFCTFCHLDQTIQKTVNDFF